VQRSTQNLAKLAKVVVKTLPLIRRNQACVFGEMVLKIEEIIQKTFKLMEFANVYAVSKLVKEFNEESESFNNGLNFKLEDLDMVFTLNLFEVNKNWLQSNKSSQGRHGKHETISKRNGKTSGERLLICFFAFSIGSTTSADLF
jgi:hypothetical protein